MTKTGKVYKITSPSGKVYIGSTRDEIKKRWKNYNSKSCKKQIKIYNSIQKYGIKKHIFEVIWEGNINEMFKMERIFGDKYEVLGKNGLNLKLPGYDDVPIIFSEETKKKMSYSRRGEKHHNYGKKASDETRKNMSESRKKEKNHRFGKHITNEHKEILRISKLGKKLSEETKKKISNALKGKYKGQNSPHFGIQKNKKAIIQYDLNLNFIKKWDCIKNTGILLNICHQNISRACRYPQRTAGGFKWRFDN